MWIVLAVIAFLVLLITVICLLPVKVLLKNDEQNALILRYKFLFKTFGENPDPNDPIVKTLKKAGGVDRLEKEALQSSISTDGLKKTVSDSYSTLIGLIKEILFLLKYGVITRLHVCIRCTGDDAAETAIHYGQCCSATYSLVNALSSYIKIRKRGCKLDIGCDFSGKEPLFRYDIVLRISFGRVLAGFWKVVLAEAKRTAQAQLDQQK